MAWFFFIFIIIFLFGSLVTLYLEPSLTLIDGISISLSCLANIGPDQRIYRQEGLDDSKQNVKPITYVASKWAVVGMTKYLATYFADRGIRVNCLSPTGVWNERIPEHMVAKISSLNPMNRMANADEYKGAIVFSCKRTRVCVPCCC